MRKSVLNLSRKEKVIGFNYIYDSPEVFQKCFELLVYKYGFQDFQDVMNLQELIYI